jgi:hypothetical protein
VVGVANAVSNPAEMSPNRQENYRSMRGRVVASILGPVVWLSFTLLYVGFWAKGFSLFQSVIVILVSIIVLAGMMAALWASFGMRQARWAWG